LRGRLLRRIAPWTGVNVFRCRLIVKLRLWRRRFQDERPRIVTTGKFYQRLDTRFDRGVRTENVGKAHARIVDAHFHHGRIRAGYFAAPFDLAQRRDHGVGIFREFH
jgi:hypothetical protein